MDELDVDSDNQIMLEQKAVLENLPDSVFLLDEKGSCLRVFPGDNQLYNFDYRTLVGKNVHDVYPAWFSKFVISTISEVFHTNLPKQVTYSFDTNKLSPDQVHPGNGEVVWIEAIVKVLDIPVNGKRVVMWAARDVSKQKKLELEVRKLVEKDDLTDLYNRRKFMDELEQNFNEFSRYHSSYSLLMIDADNFKCINDEVGHQAGDKVLQCIARTCDVSLRQSDLLARIGGEEFAALLPNTSLYEAWELAEQLRRNIELCSVCLEGRTKNVTVSIGIASFLETDTRYSDILRRADLAMYKSKREGKNRVTLSHNNRCLGSNINSSIC